jgi:hypothetical protein
LYGAVRRERKVRVVSRAEKESLPEVPVGEVIRESREKQAEREESREEKGQQRE